MLFLMECIGKALLRDDIPHIPISTLPTIVQAFLVWLYIHAWFEYGGGGVRKH